MNSKKLSLLRYITNLTKYTWDLYDKNIKVMEEIQDWSKWTDILYSQTGRHNIVKTDVNTPPKRQV